VLSLLNNFAYVRNQIVFTFAIISTGKKKIGRKKVCEKPEAHYYFIPEILKSNPLQ
jgi:hypothetical protein